MYSQKEHGVDVTELEAAKAMLSGESGIREFRRGNDNWYVFFKPFERVNWEGRSSAELGWSVGVVYPENDIFSIHNILVYLVVGIAIAGMLVFYLLLNWIIRRQLKPLIRLTKSAHYIASGNYSESLPYSDRLDEIGLLQNQFCDMQRSLQGQVDELEEETKLLKRQDDMLRAAYDKTVEGDKMKSSFLRYITNQMAEPMKSIDNSVTSICNNYQNISKEEMDQLVDNIQRQNQTMTNLLNPMAHFTKSDTGKEADHA
jgi:methyl-accepting chemotaxis protein